MRSRLAVVAGLVGLVGSLLVGVGPAVAAEAQWGLNNAHQGGPAISFGFGSDACSPATGDWDGDGDTNVAGACPSGGEWQWGLASAQGGSAWRSYGYGSTRCTPVAGDWDGDGDTNVGIACPESGEWQWSLNSAHQGGSPWRSYGYGSTRCTPVTGDWDGDGDTNVGIACPQSGEWQWSLNSAHQGGSPWRSYGYGSTRCTPVTGDWDGDGDTNVGIACPQSGEWQWSLNSAHQGGSAWRSYGFGSTSKLPVTGDWDGDGDTTAGAVNMTAPGGGGQVTLADLQAIYGTIGSTDVVNTGLPSLNTEMSAAGITTPARKAAFLATLRNESGFRYNAVESGSTSTYRGRGFIQLTGSFNYGAAGQYLGVNLTGNPGAAASLQWSAKIARWYWTVARDINPMADRLDMGAVNVAIGYAPSAAEDAERCADFKAALRYFNGGVLPGGIDCTRTALAGAPGLAKPAIEYEPGLE